ERVQLYESIGYPVLTTCSLTGQGLPELRALLVERATVVSGPSGVGKSSLLGQILGRQLRIGEISSASLRGQHTTSAVTWYPLPDGGAVIDTPGFREFGLWNLEPRDLAGRMPDLRSFLGKCRFRDCLHRQEPDCQIRLEVDTGAISAHRYRSYLGILESLLEQKGRC
ncbi:MAG: ribosome small subunit-dependent GTPase A, partial [Planctomycetota bacterium]